jgi:hypothetical protein
LQNEVPRIIAHASEIEHIETEPASRSDDPIVQETERNPGELGVDRGLERSFVNGAKDDAVSLRCDRSSDGLVALREVLRDPK